MLVATLLEQRNKPLSQWAVACPVRIVCRLGYDTVCTAWGPFGGRTDEGRREANAGRPNPIAAFTGRLVSPNRNIGFPFTPTHGAGRLAFSNGVIQNNTIYWTDTAPMEQMKFHGVELKP